MTTIERSVHASSNSQQNADPFDNEWVVKVLDADDLKLAEAKESTLYGRAKLGLVTRILMWAMRVYVLLSVILIIAQIYISLKAH